MRSNIGLSDAAKQSVGQGVHGRVGVRVAFESAVMRDTNAAERHMIARLESMSDLTPEQQVDAMRLLGYEGFAEIRDLDAWYSWRAGIGAKGQWQYFVAGD